MMGNGNEQWAVIPVLYFGNIAKKLIFLCWIVQPVIKHMATLNT